MLNANLETQDKKSIADNIMKQAKFNKYLIIWTDCDREGEHIGTEVRDQAKEGNQRIIVRRAKFNNTERAYVNRAFFPLNFGIC